MRAVRGAAFFRTDAVFPRVRETIRRASGASFRVVHYSVQANHVHLLLEADDGAALRRGMQALTTRLARTVNEAVGRHGKVWSERYHRHDLEGPTEVRRALVYVLQKGRKHGVVARHALDPLSSAAWLVGWDAQGARLARDLVARARAVAERDDELDTPVAPAGTWLLRQGWLTRGGGELDPREQPRPRHA